MATSLAMMMKSTKSIIRNRYSSNVSPALKGLRLHGVFELEDLERSNVSPVLKGFEGKSRRYEDRRLPD